MLSPALPFDLAGELWTMKKFLKTKKTREAIAACPGLTNDGAGAIYLFTCESPLYKELNAKLRARDRAALKVRSKAKRLAERLSRPRISGRENVRVRKLIPLKTPLPTLGRRASSRTPGCCTKATARSALASRACSTAA